MTRGDGGRQRNAAIERREAGPERMFLALIGDQAR
jgi:hypothetical protein